MFEQISSKLQSVFKTLRGQARLKEEHVDQALREIRLALLEADVHVKVAKSFCKKVRERAVGDEILSSLTAAQQVIKVCRDEMVELLGGREASLDLEGRPAVVLLVGLQGSGKTTTAAKLARWLREQGKHPALVSVDVRRPAALEQLDTLAGSVSVRCLSPETVNPVERAEEAVRSARDHGFDVLVIDTAGRVHVDDELMRELAEIADKTQPAESLFVADAMTGQDAVRSARKFSEAITVSGHVLTKLEGDARGGAALSIVSVTDRPIKFVGLGEKLDALEPFRPDRMASRILGMGDVLGLIERAEKSLEHERAEELARKIRKDDLDLEDFRAQLRQMKRMGSLSEIMSLMPGAGQMPAEVDESELGRFEAILDSMTPYERSRPSVVNGSRRRRIARGSGTSVTDVNRLLRRFGEAKKMVRKLTRVARSGKGGSKKLARMLGGFVPGR